MPQISSTTPLSSEVIKPPIVDPTPCSEPQTTAGSSSGGERRSGCEKRPTAKKKDLPNQDLWQRPFAVKSDKGDNDLINPDTIPSTHAFYAAVTKTYGHRDNFPPRPKIWREILSHIKHQSSPPARLSRLPNPVIQLWRSTPDLRGCVGHGSSSTAEVRQVLFHHRIRLYYPSLDLSRDPCKGSISYVY